MIIQRTDELVEMLNKHAGGQFTTGEPVEVDDLMYQYTLAVVERKHGNLHHDTQIALACFICLFKHANQSPIAAQQVVEKVVSESSAEPVAPTASDSVSTAEPLRVSLSLANLPNWMKVCWAVSLAVIALITRLLSTCPLIAVLLLTALQSAYAQPGSRTAGPGQTLNIQLQNNGAVIGTRSQGLLGINCPSATFINSVWTCTVSGSAGATGATGATGAAGSTGATGATGQAGYFPNQAQKGAMYGTSSYGAAFAGNTFYWPGASAANANCLSYLTKPGVFRGVAGYTANTNGLIPVIWGLNAGCGAYVTAGSAQPAFGPPGSFLASSQAAGSIVTPTAYVETVHAPMGGAVSFVARSNGGAPATFASMNTEYISDDGLGVTPINNGGTALTASTTAYLGAAGMTQNTTELAGSFPIPVAGSVDIVGMCQMSTTAGQYTGTLRKNGANSGLAAITLWGGPNCYFAAGSTVSYAAGDYASVQMVTTTGTMVAVLTQIAFTPTNVLDRLVYGAFGAAGSTIAATKTYFAPMTNRSATTEIAQITATHSMTCTNLYVLKSTTSPGVTTTYTLRANGADTALTGTDNNSATGVVAIYTGAGVSITAGQPFNLSVVSSGGTSGNLVSWAMSCQ